MTAPQKMIVYGHDFCVPARLLVRALNKHGVDYDYRDVVRGNPHWQKELKNLANGNLSVPTIVFPNGDVFVEPRVDHVLAYLGLKEPGWFDRLADWFAGKGDTRADEE